MPAGCRREQRYREAIAESICDGAASRDRIGQCAANEPKRAKTASGGDKGSDRSGDEPRSPEANPSGTGPAHTVSPGTTSGGARRGSTHR